VTESQTRRREKQGNPRLKRKDDVELDLKNIGVRRGGTRSIIRRSNVTYSNCQIFMTSCKEDAVVR
jgi:hypothetical protein